MRVTFADFKQFRDMWRQLRLLSGEAGPSGLGLAAQGAERPWLPAALRGRRWRAPPGVRAAAHRLSSTRIFFFHFVSTCLFHFPSPQWPWSSS